MLSAFPVFAQRPIIQTKFTADPAPMVHRDTVYLYTTHDEDDAEGFKMRDWLLYTSTDMVNWTDHGAVASLKDFKWYDGDNGAWAEQVIYRNGLSTVMVSAYLKPTPLMVLSAILSANPSSGKRSTGTISTPLPSSMRMDRPISTGVTPMSTMSSSTRT